MSEGGGLASDLRDAGGEVAAVAAPDRQLDHPGPPARGGRKKGGPDHAIGRSRGGLSTKINALVDEQGLPIRIVLSAGQASDRAAVPALIEGLPPARALIADRGYDAQADHITTRQYARLVGEWVAMIDLDPSAYGTHSLRRTKVALLYKKTGNLRACQLLLGHRKLESTVRYLGVEVDDALALSEQIEI